MAEISRGEAVRRLAHEIKSASPDDLTELHNELFVTEALTEQQVRRDPDPVRQRLTDHVNRGLLEEELVALWPLVFPKHWHIEFDEESNSLRFQDEPEPADYLE